MARKNRRILFASPGPDIVAPASGEGTRLKHLSKELSQLEWDVYGLVPETTTSNISWMEETYVYDQWAVPHLTDLNPSFISNLSSLLYKEEFDVLHLSKGVCTAALLSRVLSEDTVVSYAAQNLEAEHAREFVDPELPVYKRVLGPQLIPRIERLTVACADTITTVSGTDRNLFLDRYNPDSIQIESIPTGTQLVDTTELAARTETCSEFGLKPDAPVGVFHGSYSHPPNQEAFDLIANEVNPVLQEQECSVQFLFVGEGVPEFSASNIVTAGYVEDLYSVLHGADFATVPILHGGGTKTKIYDYISLGLPFITTRKAIEGISVEHGQHARVTADVGAEFISATAELAQDRELRKEYQQNLHQLRQDMTWPQSSQKIDKFYSQAIKGFSEY